MEFLHDSDESPVRRFTPADADIVLDGTKTSPDAAAEQILNVLFARGYFDTAD